MKFSIIIPAYNEEASISDAVKSLIANQKFTPRQDFEIIVVDNGSTDKTKQKALEAGADKVVFEAEKGANIARQRGFLSSCGEIIAFLDADCVAPENWLSLIEKRLKTEKFAAVSGPANYSMKGIKKILSDFWQKIFYPKVPKILYFFFRKKTGIILNGNWATKRKVIEEIGGIPKVAFEGDDAFIANLIARKVGPIFFDSKLIVKSSDRRFRKEGFLKTAWIYAINYLGVYFKNRPIIVSKQQDIR